MYKLQKMTDERAKMILEDIIAQLSDIPEDEMTSFELGILHSCTENPPSRRHGVEWTD